MKRSFFAFFLTISSLVATLSTLAADDVVIYGSVERSEAWITSSQYRTGYYSVSLARDFEPLGALQQSPTVTDGAVYVDGYCYYLKKTYASVVRYSLDFCKMNVSTWKVEQTIAKSNGTLSLANDMTYDPVGRMVYAASPRSYGSRDTDLRTVDLATGEFTTVAQLSVGIRTLAADSKGQLWGLGTEIVEGTTTTFLYRINKNDGTLTRIGAVGLNMTEGETGMAFDLRDDRLYWTANYYTDDELWQRTYSSGLVELNTETGQATLLKPFSHNEKVVGMFINTDQPNGPQNLKPKAPTQFAYELLEGDSSVRLSWQAPSLCEDERTPVDTEELTYTVRRLTDGQTVAEGLRTTTFTDTPPFQMQLTAYTVVAVTAGGQSEALRSDNFVCGQPYNTPYLETFDRQANFNAYTIIDSNGDRSEDLGGSWFWDYNNQAALYYTNFNYADDWFISPAIRMATDRVYRLRFGTAGYLTNGASNHLRVSIGSAATVDAQDRLLIDETYTTSQTPQWLTALFVPREGDCRIGFHNVSEGRDHLYLDNVYVIEYGSLGIPAAPTEATFTMDDEAAGVRISVTAPTTTVDGQPLPALSSLGIYRTGATVPFHVFENPAPGEFLSWIDNDVALGTNTYMFAASNAEGTGMELYATFLNTHSEEDEIEDPVDDSTPLLPYVTDLHTTTDETLVWTDATVYPPLHPLTEDVESLEPYSISGGKGWTTVDQDGARTIGISTSEGTLSWPHAMEAQGFIVFRPLEVLREVIVPRSGDQCFVAFSAAGRANDDWLISPQLTGDEQTISFYAKCMFPNCLNERMEIWISETDAQPSSFVRLSGDEPRAVTSYEQWQRFRYTLPCGTRHFAIRCVSLDQFGLMIDDIHYAPAYPAADLLGYNVYLDGARLNETPIEDTQWHPTAAGSYTVSALYLQGESRPSEPVEVLLTGVEPITTTDSQSSSNVYDLQGRRTTQQSFRLFRKNIGVR